MDDFAEFYVHTVTSEPFLGSGSHGPIFGGPVDVSCFVNETTRFVRDSEGVEVLSTATIAAPKGEATHFPAGSLVTLPSGRVSRVLSLVVADSGPLDLPDHMAAACE